MYINSEMEAAQTGDINALYALILEDPYILENIDKIPFADTPLHVAALNGNTEFAIEMITMKPSFGRELNCNGFSPIHLALQNEKIQTVLCLLEIDVELVRVRGRGGITPLHYVIEKGDLYLLARFLSVCPNSVEDVTTQRETTLHIALRNNNTEAFKFLFSALQSLRSKGAQYTIKKVLNWKDKDGNTLLHLATYRNQQEVVEILLCGRAIDVNIQNLSGFTALDILGQTGKDEIKNILSGAGALTADALPRIATIEYFLRADQRLNKVAENGNIDALYVSLREDAYVLEQIDEIPFVDTPLHIAASTGQIQFALEVIRLKPSFARKQNQDGYTPMHLALLHEKTELLYRLLDVDRNLVRVQGREGKTPLHYVAEKGNVDLLCEFLTACPDAIEDRTIQKETALHIVTKNNNLNALEILLNWLQYVDKEEILKWTDDQGNTLLHIAIFRRHIQMVKPLINRVPINARNSENLTALDILERQVPEDERVKDMLRRGGAKRGALVSVVSISDALTKKISSLQKIKIWDYRRRLCPTNSDNRNAILVVAVLIATATYQAALLPTNDLFDVDTAATNDTRTDATKEKSSDHQDPYYWVLPIMGWVSPMTFYVAIMVAFITSMSQIRCLLPPGNGILVNPILFSFGVIMLGVTDYPTLLMYLILLGIFWLPSRLKVPAFVHRIFKHCVIYNQIK